jgi:hypothetical protein
MSTWKHRGLCVLSFIVFAVLGGAGFASVTPSKIILLAKITGPGSINQTDIKYQVMGTDLGTMWDSGKGQIMMAFGGYCQLNSRRNEGWDSGKESRFVISSINSCLYADRLFPQTESRVHYCSVS